MRRWFGIVTVAFVLVAGAPYAAADTVTIAPSIDNSLYEEDATVSNGAGDHLFAGATKDGFLRRGLVAFDVAGAIPAGSTVTGVTLHLYLSRTKAKAEDVSLHLVTSDWGEGTSHADGEEGEGAPATIGDATWTHTFWDTTLWSTPGGDFDPTASATTSVGDQNGFYQWSSDQMVVDVQAWLDDPTISFGWILLGNETVAETAKRFDTRLSTELSRRPYMEITFTPPSGTGACCATDGTCTVSDTASCGGSYQGDGTACDPNPCPEPTGACCLPDASATCVSDTESNCTAMEGTFQGASTTCELGLCPVVLTPYLDPLPVPAPATPTAGTAGGTADYNIAIRQTTQQLHAELPATTVWGYDDGTGTAYPGPTLETTTGNPIQVTWVNDLRDAGGTLRTSHYLAVDACMHGASDDAKTVVHLHGGHVPANVDGHPEATFTPGQSVVYEYPNNQPAATLWYHDHALGITRLNVYMGLAGFYIVRDDTEAALDLPAGAYDIPLVIQDRTFNPDGSLYYPGDWAPMFFGDTLLVNGKAWPYLEVDQGKYRFRVLNGSNSRTYTLSLSNGDTFQVVGNDGGLLQAPVSTSEVTVSPGERVEIVIDFAGLATGTEVELLNSAPAPYPGNAGEGVIPEVMKFIVQSQTGHTNPLPASLRPMETIDPAQAVATRTFDLEKFTDACAGEIWLINGLGWNDITELPVLGTTEIWSFRNQSGMMHPMHMHLVFFQVIGRGPIGGPFAAPPPEEAGWKDTVQVGANEEVRVIARFEDYTGLYPYHCHILEHEDHEMMRQFQSIECADDTHCDDGDACNGAETCDTTSNTCTAGTAPVCDDGIACTTDTCDPSAGCVSTPDDTACNDGNDCTTDTCDPATGCQHANVTDGSACQDGAGNSGTCLAGVCEVECTSNVECDDGNVCTGTETCDTSTNLCVSGTPLVCDDGDVCNGTETCDPVMGCQEGTPLACDDGNDCTVNTCDPTTGCQTTQATDGTPCTDATGSPGACAGGVCELAAPDAGTGDAGTQNDAGIQDDAGTPTDAGTQDDAGAMTDAGTQDDAGAMTDAGIQDDAGTPTDAGAGDGGAPPQDAGSDAGTVPPSDAGVDAGPASPESGGCGCRVTGPSPTEGLGAFLLLLWLLGRGARWPRRRS